MKWKKLGQVFAPDHHYDWMVSHAANPVADHLSDSLYRVYSSCRDKNNKSSIYHIDFNINQPDKILNISKTPILSPGDPGYFDDSGVTVTGLVTVDKIKYLYYLGWNLGVTVPWRNSIGLAISDSTGCIFTKYSPAPIIDRNSVDPLSISYPWILHENGIWKMWYGSNLEWDQDNDCAFKFCIKYAESENGINWRRDGIIAITFKSADEYALARPCVINDNGIYKMWYSYRGISYRIGYAESDDGINWTRLDEEVGIDVSKTGWDSEMIEYPHVFDHKRNRYMLYNGNAYGKTGFGLAVLESD